MPESIGRVGIMILVGVAVAACTGSSGRRLDGPLVLLTRDGCVNTAVLQANVEAALASAPAESPRFTVTMIDLDTLPETDVRRGYPTPTLLYANRDVFGLPEPRPPLPQPT